MPVDSVSGPKFFTSRGYTDNGNEYRRSNYGKIAGTTLGLGAGTYIATKGAKIYKEVVPLAEKSGLLEALPQLINSIAPSVDETFKPLTEAEIEKLPKEFLKYGKKGFKGIIAGLAVGATLLGIAVGGTADGITNIFKRRNADKAAKAEN